MSTKNPLTLAIAGLVLASLALPTLHAAPDEHVEVLAESDAGGEHYYLVDDHGALQLWKETNGLTTSGQKHRFTGEPTGLQAGDGCLLDDGTFVYLDHDEHHGDTSSTSQDECAVGVFYEADTRITTGGVLDGLLA